MVYFSQFYQWLTSHRYNGRGDRIRTCDPLLPKQMRYQAALLPDMEHVLSVRPKAFRLACQPKPERAKAGGPGGTRTPDLAVMSGQL